MGFPQAGLKLIKQLALEAEYFTILFRYDRNNIFQR